MTDNSNVETIEIPRVHLLELLLAQSRLSEANTQLLLLQEQLRSQAKSISEVLSESGKYEITQLDLGSGKAFRKLKVSEQPKESEEVEQIE